MAAQGDADFTAFVQRHARFVFRVANSVLRNVPDAEDVVQEVFLKLYRNRAWRDAKDEKAFLARTAWRMAVDRLPQRSTLTEETIEIVSDDPGPEQAAISSNWESTVHRLIDGLPEDLRQPLALSTINSMTSAEIAKIIGIPEGTVRTRILRARQLLREKLAALERKQYVARPS